MWHDFVDFVVPVGIAAAVTIVSIVLLIAGISKLSAQTFPTRLEVTRSAVQRLGCAASEDVIGLAVSKNANIASHHWWNQTVFAFMAPNEIAEAQPIEIPVCAK